jgi:hypothetical protein
MKLKSIIAVKVSILATLLGVTVAVSLPCVHAAPAARAPGAPITKGQKIVMATHSFNVFIGPVRANARNPEVKPGPGPLAALAAERGKLGHETLQVQMIGGSTPMQHWKQGDGDETKNLAKVALARAGDQLDVFTLSPNAVIPEEGIDQFGDFVIAHNPNARILVQVSWSSWDGHGRTPSVGGTGGGAFTNADRDRVDLAMLDRWIQGQGDGVMDAGYLGRLREQLAGIDRRAGREITHVVPSGRAVYLLRKEVLLGRVPGVAKQSELYRDPIGHPTQVTANLVTYVWFATMYRETPLGLQALIDRADPFSGPREKRLQQIAWNAVVGEPKSGVQGQPVAVGD